MTRSASGPYEPWQVVGCLLCLVVLVVTAVRLLPVAVVIGVVSVVFTAAWSVSAATVANSIGVNLWPIGAVMVFIGMLGGTALVAAVAEG